MTRRLILVIVLVALTFSIAAKVGAQTISNGPYYAIVGPDAASEHTIRRAVQHEQRGCPRPRSRPGLATGRHLGLGAMFVRLGEMCVCGYW